MIRFLSFALLALFPAIADACPLQTRSYPPGTVFVYQSSSCCWGWGRRVQVVQVVEANTAEPTKQALGGKYDPDWEKWVSIKGRIVWDKSKGDVPKRLPIKATKDQNVAMRDGNFYTEDWVVDEHSLGIKNVVVWLSPEVYGDDLAALKKAMEVKRSYKFPTFKPVEIHPALQLPSLPPATMSIPYLRFDPHVLAVREGQHLVIANRTTVPHNAKWTSRDNGEYNLLLPPGGSRTFTNLKAERFPIELASEIHPWMKAWLRVFDHPYFAVTDVNGNFEIKNAPVLNGKLRMFIWQENGMHRGAEGRFGQTIEVKGGVMDLKEFKFDAGKR